MDSFPPGNESIPHQVKSCRKIIDSKVPLHHHHFCQVNVDHLRRPRSAGSATGGSATGAPAVPAAGPAVDPGQMGRENHLGMVLKTSE